MRFRDEVEDILSAEVRAASERHRLAHEAFHAVVEDIPSKLPAPDGVLRIQNAGRERRAALEQLRSALDRFNAFVQEGKIPEDLLS